MNQKQKFNTELQVSNPSRLLKRFKPNRSQLISGAMMLTAGVLALAAAPTVFTSGTTISASSMNANFSDINTRLIALETVPAFQAPTFLTGWGDVGSPYATAGYTKDAMGFVHLRGLIKRSSGTGGNIFALPVGYRPSALLQFPARCGDDTMCLIHVNSHGNVDFGGTGSPAASLTLDGIIFDPH